MLCAPQAGACGVRRRLSRQQAESLSQISSCPGNAARCGVGVPAESSASLGDEIVAQPRHCACSRHEFAFLFAQACRVHPVPGARPLRNKRRCSGDSLRSDSPAQGQHRTPPRITEPPSRSAAWTCRQQVTASASSWSQGLARPANNSAKFGMTSGSASRATCGTTRRRDCPLGTASSRRLRTAVAKLRKASSVRPARRWAIDSNRCGKGP